MIYGEIKTIKIANYPITLSTRPYSITMYTYPECVQMFSVYFYRRNVFLTEYWICSFHKKRFRKFSLLGVTRLKQYSEPVCDVYISEVYFVWFLLLVFESTFNDYAMVVKQLLKVWTKFCFLWQETSTDIAVILREVLMKEAWSKI